MGLGTVLALTIAAGAAIPIGGLIALALPLNKSHFQRDLLHAIMAFGGGVLVAAVALVLVPEGIGHLGATASIVAFLAGSLFFMGMDAFLHARGGAAANAAATVMDFVPESLALGAAFAGPGNSGPLLAMLIGAQNLPEGFNSFAELIEAGKRKGRVLLLLSALVLLGPAAGIVGYAYLGGRPDIIGAATLFASGGILFGLFHDLAPRAVRNCHYAPTLGATGGFLLGLAGQFLLG